jgi:hypothetical protein
VTNDGREPIEEEVVFRATLLFVNGGPLPDFLLRLPGVPLLLVPLRLPAGAVIDRVTGEPAKVEAHLRQGPVPFDDEAARALDDLRSSLRADMAAIARGRLSRARRKEIRAEADRVTVELRGSQRAMRPAFLRTPDLQAALGYVLHLIATRQYGRRLAECKRRDCPKLFVREPKRARPQIYCSPEHAKEGKEEASRLRAQDYRTRQKAIEALRSRFPQRARELVRAVYKRGNSVEEVVKAAHAAAKHK